VPADPPPPNASTPPSYRRFILLGVVLLALGIGAGIWLLSTVGDSSTSSPSTEQQVLGGGASGAVDSAGGDLTATTVTLAAGGRANTPTIAASSTTRPTTTKAGATTTTRPAKDAAGFTIVRPAQLPKEAQQTLALVEKGGPYPYDRDGIEFQNREKILPKKAAGYYHEYTVVTPGSDDRGARRIIAGSAGERYYTADHYASFVRVIAS
jgi:ribonuclease T1